MPPRKKPRCSSPDLEAPARRSSRPNRGIGGHAAQLQRVGETVAAPTRKGPKGDNLQISSSEENPMAPSQLQKGKKKMFGFKEPWSNGRKMAERNVGQQDAGHERESTERDSGCEKERRNTEDYKEFAPSSHEGDTSDDNADCDDDPDSNTPMDRYAGQHTHQRTDDADDGMDFDKNMDRPRPDDEAQGGVEPVASNDELTDPEQDKAYDVLKCHHAKNGQQKAPSPTYLSKGKGKEQACTFKLPGGASTVQVVRRRSPTLHSHPSHSKSPRQQSSQQDRYVRTSSSRTQSPLQCPSRPITSSSRSHTQPTSRRSSPPHSPSDPILPSSCEHSRTSTPEDAHQSSNSKQKVKTNQEDPSKLGFYPPTWQTFLQMAKLEMRLQAVLATPVPESQEALNLAREVLDTVLWTYHEKKIKLERGYFPEYSTQMCQLLCNDLFTFRTELKKIVVSIAKRAYNIFLQGSTMRKEECQRQVTAAATRLLKSGDYLRLPDSSGGNFKNFTAQALKDACLKFYYSNSKKALKNTDEFHQTIPINAMLLVVAVLKGVISGFRETGTDKVPELTAEQCRAHFVNLWKSIDTLLNVLEHREELEDMLEQWARIGMGDFNEYADGSASDAEDVNIIL
ncbi:hypothetical protein EV424DRAFT_1538062 [Suillus variegatus]|nr:hypothetical protein EV424DRAFT_1538062 [Suillus variegatus]